MVSILNKKSTIIRKENTVVSGKICLGAGSPVAPVRNPAASAPISPAQAKVVENTAEYVLIELQCQCGEVMNLKCNYADIAIPGLS